MVEEYINKGSLKYLLNMLFNYYKENDVETIELECLKNDLADIIDNMIVLKKEHITGGAE